MRSLILPVATAVLGALIGASALAAEPELVLAVEGSTPGTTDIIRVLDDGSPGGPLPDLTGITILDLLLPSVVEQRQFRADLAGPVLLGGHRAVRLPARPSGGSVLLRYARSAPDREGLMQVDRQGGAGIVWEEPVAAPGEPAIDPSLAVSDHGPFAALLAGDPPRLLLYRTDGTNWPGTSSPVRDATPPGAQDLDGAAVVFGRDLMCVIDKTLGPFLVPVAGGAAFVPALPPSGGQPPVEFDEEIAVSAEGHHFAFGAGSGKKVKDIYVVRDDGAAVNITDSPADYGEVGYTNPGRIVELALNAGGTMVAFVNHSTPEPEAFVSSVELPDPVHITTSEAFVDSIDIGTTVRFVSESGILIVAGLDLGTLDLYTSPTGTDSDIVNLTRTSPIGEHPPYGLGSQLTLFDLGSLAGWSGTLARVHREVPQTRGRPPRGSSRGLAAGDRQAVLHGIDALVAIDALAQGTRLVASRYQGVGAAIGTGDWIAVAEGDHLVVADPGATGAAFRRTIALSPGQTIRRLALDPATQRIALVAGPDQDRLHLWLADPASGLAARLTGQAAPLGDLFSGHLADHVHFLAPAPSGAAQELWRFTPADGVIPLGVEGIEFFAQAH